MEFSAGKFRGFQKVGNDAGVFKMVAVDQRTLSSIRSSASVRLAKRLMKTLSPSRQC